VVGVHVHQHAVSGASLAAVACDGVAVIDVRVIPDVELHILLGVEPNLEISLRVDLLDGSELAIGNVLLPVRGSQLHAVGGGSLAAVAGDNVTERARNLPIGGL
jgi:hypothetical protein